MVLGGGGIRCTRDLLYDLLPPPTLMNIFLFVFVFFFPLHTLPPFFFTSIPTLMASGLQNTDPQPSVWHVQSGLPLLLFRICPILGSKASPQAMVDV